MQMTFSAIKPRLTFWQLWNMSFGFFGIQFGFMLQNTNTSRVFMTMGANPDDLSLFWLAAPVTGLLVQPIIGYFSDNLWHPFWGRRRPFFFAGALLAAITLVAMPNSVSLWMAIIVLWMMDVSINVAMEPFRAFVGDKLDPSQQTAGFAMQSFFIGCGSVIAALLPLLFEKVLGFSNESVAGAVPPTVRYSFYVGAFAFASAVAYTVFTTPEIPPTDLAAFRAERAHKKGFGQVIGEILAGFGQMPPTMVQLAVVSFFSWSALFIMWVNMTPAVALSAFGTLDASTKQFQDAGTWVGVMSAVYNAVSAVAAFLLPVLGRRTNRKAVYTGCLIFGGVSLASVCFITDKYMLLIPMIGVGVAWASILTVPYAILVGSLPASKMGYFMGIFNFFVVIPQLVAGVVLGPISKHLLGSHPGKTLLLAGACMIISGLVMLRVRDDAMTKPVH